MSYENKGVDLTTYGLSFTDIRQRADTLCPYPKELTENLSYAFSHGAMIERVKIVDKAILGLKL